MCQSRGTSSGKNVPESQRGCRASPPSLHFFSVWWTKRWVCEEGGNTQCSTIFQRLCHNSHKCFHSTCLRSGLRIDDPVLWLWTLRRHWVIDLGSGWHFITEDQSPEKGPSLSRWRAPQSGYGSVLTPIWLEIPLSSSCCGPTRIYLGLTAVRERVFRFQCFSYTERNLKLHLSIFFLLTINQMTMCNLIGVTCSDKCKEFRWNYHLIVQFSSALQSPLDCFSSLFSVCKFSCHQSSFQRAAVREKALITTDYLLSIKWQTEVSDQLANIVEHLAAKMHIY